MSHDLNPVCQATNSKHYPPHYRSPADKNWKTNLYKWFKSGLSGYKQQALPTTLQEPADKNWKTNLYKWFKSGLSGYKQQALPTTLQEPRWQKLEN